MLDLVCFWVDWQDGPHFTANQVYKVNFDHSNNSVFELTLELYHFKILDQGFAQSMAGRSLWSVQSQPKICTLSSLAERSKKPCSAGETTSYTQTGARWLCLEFKVETSRLLPGLPSHRWLKKSESLFDMKTTDESLDRVLTIWNSELWIFGGPSLFNVDAGHIVAERLRTRYELIDLERINAAGTNSWMDIDANLVWSIGKQNRLIIYKEKTLCLSEQC